jgi:hypothetical protein
MRKEHHSAAGGHGGYIAYMQDKAEYDALKLMAWHKKVSDHAG